ncbi:MAG: TonB-dependent receptor [Myxococcota bacterium]|nr:TonB-dependent receptor [Myxococcota bacterium]
MVTKDAKDFAGLRLGAESGLFNSVRPWVGYGGAFELGKTHGEVTTEIEYFKQWGPTLYFDPVYGGIDPVTGRPYRYTTSPVGTGVWGGGSSSSLTTTESASIVSRVRLGKFELSLNGQVARAPLRVSVVDFDTQAVDTSRRLLVNLAYADQVSSRLALKTHAYLNASDGLTTITTSWAPECPIPDINCRNEVLAQGILAGIEAAPSFDWLKNGTLVTLLGADAAVRSARSIFNEHDSATGAPVAISTGQFDHQDGALGAYAQQTWNPVKMLGVNGGGRLDYDPRFAPVLSPRLAVRVDPWAGGTLKAIYSAAFRAPSFFESYFSHPLNPLPHDLHPEHVRSVEGSVEQRFAAQRILFGVFATEWTDLIAYYNFSTQAAQQYVAQGKSILPPLYQYRNLSSVRNWGFNAAFEGSQAHGALQYGVNVTASMTRQQEDAAGTATPLTVAPRLLGNARVSYRLPAEWPTLALAVSAQEERAVENAFVSGFPRTPFAPAQVVFRATLSGDVPGLKALSYRVTGFYSTTDHEPYLAGPNITGSARNTSPALIPIDSARVSVALEYRFSP